MFPFNNFYRNAANVLFQTYGRLSVKGKSASTPIEDISYDGIHHWSEYVPTEECEDSVMAKVNLL